MNIIRFLQKKMEYHLSDKLLISLIRIKEEGSVLASECKYVHSQYLLDMGMTNLVNRDGVSYFELSLIGKKALEDIMPYKSDEEIDDMVKLKINYPDLINKVRLIRENYILTNTIKEYLSDKEMLRHERDVKETMIKRLLKEKNEH